MFVVRRGGFAHPRQHCCVSSPQTTLYTARYHWMMQIAANWEFASVFWALLLVSAPTPQTAIPQTKLHDKSSRINPCRVQARGSGRREMCACAGGRQREEGEAG